MTAYETLSDPLREIHDLMADFNNFYAAEQSKATEYACTVGEALADWIEKAEGCLVLPNDTPVNFMPSTMRPSATLATTSSSATTTRPARG